MASSEQKPRGKYRILFLGSQMATGGAQRVLLDQAGWFHHQGYQVKVAFFYDREGLGEKWRAAYPFPVIDLGAWRSRGGVANPFRLLRGWFRLYRLLRKGQFAVVETFTHHANLLGLPAAWAAGTPVRAASHHGRIGDFPGWLTRLHAWMINSPLASCLVVVSERVLSYAVESEGIKPEKIFVIANGIELAQQPLNSSDRAALANELGLPPGGLLALSVGRLTEQKGHIYLLEAIPAILEQYPTTAFAIAGEGPLRGELEATAERLGISKSVRFLGTRSDVPALLQIADVFALPSLWEGLPIALLEAMGAGLPVIATRVEGVEEMIVDGENGLLVQPADSESLKTGLMRLLAHLDLRVNLGTAGRALVESSFSLDQMGERYEDLFLRLVERKQ
jgi:glycosyltransferase involved in cell wall biosynthesis